MPELVFGWTMEQWTWVMEHLQVTVTNVEKAGDAQLAWVLDHKHDPPCPPEPLERVGRTGRMDADPKYLVAARKLFAEAARRTGGLK